MSDHTRYGYDPLLQRWVLRDEMLGMNVKVFGDTPDEEDVIRIRLSPQKHAELVAFLRRLEWEDRLKFEIDLGPGDPVVGDADGPPELVPDLTEK